MKIGITGPISTESVSQHLGPDISSLPKGMGGAPLLGTLISALLDRGHEVSAYTLDTTLPPSLKEPIVVDGGRGFKIYFGPYRPYSFRPNHWRPGRMMDFFRIERHAIERAIEIDKPDVVHAHWSYEFALAAIASKRPHLVTCHDSPVQVLRFMPNMYRLGRYFMARMVFRKAKAVSAVSPYLKDEVSRFAKVRVEVVPNPTPLTLSQQRFSSESRTAGLSQPNIAMVLNGWDGRKNPAPALEAFAMLRQILPSATLHLFGRDFGSGEKAEAWTKARKMDVGVIFHGSTPHELLLAGLSKMHLLLHPALEESCPMSLVEAMSLGLPVVGGDMSGGVPWVLDYGSAGILTDIRSPEAICKAVLKVLSDVKLYEQYSHAGYERVRNVFSSDMIVSQYEELYQATLQGQT